jgi:hypothetical protein
LGPRSKRTIAVPLVQGSRPGPVGPQHRRAGRGGRRLRASALPNRRSFWSCCCGRWLSADSAGSGRRARSCARAGDLTLGAWPACWRRPPSAADGGQREQDSPLRVPVTMDPSAQPGNRRNRSHREIDPALAAAVIARVTRVKDVPALRPAPRPLPGAGWTYSAGRCHYRWYRLCGRGRAGCTGASSNPGASLVKTGHTHVGKTKDIRSSRDELFPRPAHRLIGDHREDLNGDVAVSGTVPGCPQGLRRRHVAAPPSPACTAIWTSRCHPPATAATRR